MRVFTMTLVCCLLFVVQAKAQYFFQNKIVNSSYTTTPYQGACVCISGDGSTMMIGAPRDSNKRGTVHVYNRQGNAWVFDTSIYTPTVYQFMSGNIVDNGFGGAIAMSRDGSRAAIGRWGTALGYGGVWVFEKDVNGNWSDASGWMRPMNDPNATGGRYGIALDMTDDGSRILVGASGYGTGGGAYLLYKNGSNWQTGLLYAGNGNAGLDVAISGDGNRAFIGEPTANKIQEWDISGTYTYKGYVPVITTSFPSLQGGSIDASYTGDTLAASTINFGGTTWGAVAMKRSSTGGWSQLGNNITVANTAAIGMRVALSDDAKKIAFSTELDNNNAGAAYYTTMDASGNWSAPLKLFGNNAIGAAHQGYGLSMSGDGNVIASGGYGDASNVGATWVFMQMQPQLATGTVGGSPFCQSTSYTATVPYTGNMTGGMYTAQLSDANGSFGNPTDIGTSSSNPIIASIPPNTPMGTGYRIRVVYTGGGNLNNPFTGDQNGVPLTINACMSVHDVAGMSLTLYPNPASGSFRMEGLTRPLQYSMVNISGALIQTGEVAPQNATVHFNAPDGVYFIQLRDGENSLGAVRLIVQH